MEERESDILVGEEEVLLMMVLLREMALFRTHGDTEHAQYLLSLPPPVPHTHLLPGCHRPCNCCTAQAGRYKSAPVSRPTLSLY